MVRVTVVTNNGKVDSSLVRVLPAPNRIELSETAISLGVTDRYVIDYRLPTGTCGQIRYRSNNARVATVSSEGEVCAVSPGTTQIEVIAQNGVKASLEVTVIKYGAKHPAQTIGHRGASAYAPDNSMEAFQKANAMGASGIETDLRRTKDGVLILSHNDVVTADNGRQISISKSTLEQIQALKFDGQPLCTLEELLNYLRHQGLVEQFVRFADSKGVKRRNILIQKSYKLLEKNLFGNIIYNMLGLEAYLQYFNKTDATVIKGIEILEKGEAFPKAPVAVEEEEVTKDKKDGKKKRTAQAYSITEDPTRGFNYAKAAIS